MHVKVNQKFTDTNAFYEIHFRRQGAILDDAFSRLVVTLDPYSEELTADGIEAVSAPAWLAG